jgi:hypothetical protein
MKKSWVLLPVRRAYQGKKGTELAEIFFNLVIDRSRSRWFGRVAAMTCNTNPNQLGSYLRGGTEGDLKEVAI